MVQSMWKTLIIEILQESSWISTEDNWGYYFEFLSASFFQGPDPGVILKISLQLKTTLLFFF